MLLVHTGGMMFLIIALQIFIHNNYNPFNDLLALLIFTFTTLTCWVVEKVSLLLAHTLNLWPLERQRVRLYIEQVYREDSGIIPSWESGYVEQIEKLKRSQWYSEEGMKTIGFKQRWIKVNKDWVMEQLMKVWKGRGDGQGEGKGGGEDDEDEGWLGRWTGGEEREAILEKIAKALGLEENWERMDADDDPTYQDWLTQRSKDDDADALLDGEGEDEEVLSPVAVSPTHRSARSSTRLSTRHRHHLLTLSYRVLMGRMSATCEECGQGKGVSGVVMQLSVGLKGVMRRWYAKKRREAAVTARMNGEGGVDKRWVYGKVNKKEWKEWMEEEVDWRAVCRECVEREKERREKEGEGGEGPHVVDVMAQVVKERERKERLKAEGQVEEWSSDTSSDDEQEQAMEQAESSEEEDRPAYWQPAEREDDEGKQFIHSVSDDSEEGEGEVDERVVGTGRMMRVSLSGESMQTSRSEWRKEDVEHGLVGLGRLDLSDDSEEDEGKERLNTGTTVAQPVRDDISEDSEEEEGGTSGQRRQPVRDDISSDSEDDDRAMTRRTQRSMPLQSARPGIRTDISDDSEEEKKEDKQPDQRPVISDDSEEDKQEAAQ
jgi:hypothetical protein